MANKLGNIKLLTDFISEPWTNYIKNQYDKVNTTLRIKKLILTNGIVGSGTIIEFRKYDDVEINLTVDPSKHKHDKSQLPVSVTATPNTLALRDNSGNIYSSGSTLSNTGYKLSNGTDISNLFKATNDTYVQVLHQRMDGTGNVLTGAQLVKDGNNIVLQTWSANYCSYIADCRCQCCC